MHSRDQHTYIASVTLCIRVLSQLWDRLYSVERPAPRFLISLCVTPSRFHCGRSTCWLRNLFGGRSMDLTNSRRDATTWVFKLCNVWASIWRFLVQLWQWEEKIVYTQIGLVKLLNLMLDCKVRWATLKAKSFTCLLVCAGWALGLRYIGVGLWERMLSNRWLKSLN